MSKQIVIKIVISSQDPNCYDNNYTCAFTRISPSLFDVSSTV